MCGDFCFSHLHTVHRLLSTKQYRITNFNLEDDNLGKVKSPPTSKFKPVGICVYSWYQFTSSFLKYWKTSLIKILADRMNDHWLGVDTILVGGKWNRKTELSSNCKTKVYCTLEAFVYLLSSLTMLVVYYFVTLIFTM